MHYTRVLSVFAIALGAACTPMRQAALVYSSSASVGLNVSTGTPSNPNVALNIGYDQDDVAYVPVAVTAGCGAAGQEACEGDLQIVLGNNAQDNSSKPAEAALRNADQRLEAAVAEERRAQEQVRTATEARARAQQSLQALQSPPPADKPADGGTPAPVAVDQEAVNAARLTLNQAQDRLDTASAVAADALKKLQEAAVQQSALHQSLDQMNLHSRRDALSVFGSFEGDASAGAGAGANGGTGGEGPSATGGMVLGKMFSTGVASQMLTEGVRDSMTASAVAQCLEQVTRAVALAPAASRETLAERLSLACAASPRNRSR